MAGFPSWAIALVLIIVIAAASTTVYLIFRKRIGKRRTTVGTQEGSILEKSIGSYPSSSAYPVKPLMQINNDASVNTLKNNSNTTIPLASAPHSPYTYASHLEDKRSTLPPAVSVPVKDDNASSVCTDEIKINLPLPPPSSSFFADKMELDSHEANDIYNSYLTQQQDYVSIDLDDSKPFLSSAAATIQQKTATIRSTLRQSMRRKSTSNKSASVAPLNHFFDNISTNTSTSSIRSPTKSPAESTRMSRQSSSTSSRFHRSTTAATPSLPTTALPPPSPRPDSPLEYFSRNSSKKSLVRHESPEEEEPNSNKIMIDTIPPESYFSLPISPATPSPLKSGALKTVTPTTPSSPHVITVTTTTDTDYSMVNEINKYDVNEADDDDNDDDSQHSNQDADGTDSPLEAASAARKIIRSASRKSRTRSMIVTDEAAHAMFSSFANGKMPSTPTSSSVSKYATVRGSSKKPADIALDIKDWTSTHTKVSDAAAASPSTPSPKRALMSSTVSGSATVSGRRALKLQPSNMGHLGGSSDNLLAGNNESAKSATLGRRSGSAASASSPKSLRNLFTRASQEDANQLEQAAAIKNTNSLGQASIPPSARTSLSIVTTDSLNMENNNQESTPGSPITVEATSPYSSKNSTLCKAGNNVDTIRKMLQSSWSGNNLKESGSSHSLSSSSAGDRNSSYMGSIGSSYRPVASPLGSVNPRLQNQHLVSLSLKASTSQSTRSRPSMPIGFMNEDTSAEGGPAPTASFSSSTVRTMIPAEEAEGDQSEKKSPIAGLLGSRQQSRSHQPSKLGNNSTKKQQTGKTPAQKEREKYLKSLKA